ncbi:MAG: hypothetical protein ACYSUN_11060 [Planctomycetota bacterium]|jgi:hypothetical protein
MKYKIQLKSTTVMVTTVEVEASNDDEAVEKSLETVNDDDFDGWEAPTRCDLMDEEKIDVIGITTKSTGLLG